jgi:hypothetical protein
MLAEVAKEGIQPILHRRLPNLGTAFACLNSDKVAGVMFELFEQRRR